MTGWRAAAADAIVAQADQLRAALEQLDDAHAVLEQLGRDRACQELRATAATLRGEVNDLARQARALRANPADGDGDRDRLGLPIALTTRHLTRGQR